MSTRTARRRITAMIGGTALLVGAGVLGVAAPASAGERAPDCVKARTLSDGDVRVENDCARSKRIKVIMAWGPDLACWTIPAGGGAEWDDPLGRLDRVELC